MKAIFQKELREYKNGLFTYTVCALYLLLSGLFLVIFNLGAGSSNLLDVQNALSLFSVLLFPLLTAIALPRERQNGTDAFLFSLPLRTRSIVLGKFFALLSLFFLSALPAVLVSLCFPLWGDVSAALSLTVWIGYFAESLVLFSLCFFLSTLASRPLVSFGISLGATLVLYLLWSFAPVLPTFLYILNPFSIPGGFTFGRPDLPALLAALLLAGLFVLLSCLSIECRRSSLFGKSKSARRSRLQRIGAIASALLIVTVSLLNTFLPLLPQSIVKPSLAASETYAISPETEKAISSLQKDVTVSFLVEGGRSYADGEIYSFLRSYEELSPRLHVKVIDTDNAEFLSAHGLDADSASGTIIVESDTRSRILTSDSLYFYRNTEFGFDRMSIAEYLTQCEYIETYYNAEYLYQFVSTSTPYFDGESVLSNAVRFVCADTVPAVYTLTAGGASPLDEPLKASLELEGFAIHALESTASIPADCAMLILNAPASDLTKEEADALTAYLANGGKLLLTTSYQAGALPNLQGVLSRYGLTFGDTSKLVCEGSTSYAVYGENVADYLFFAHVAPHEISSGLENLVAIPLSHAIATSPTEGVTVTPWLYTSEKGYLYDPDATAEEGTEDTTEEAPVEGAIYTVGAIAQAGETTLLWIASPDAVTSMGDAFSNGGNFSLIKQALCHTVGYDGSALPINAAPFDLGQISLDTKALTALTVILTVLLPGGVLCAGVLRHYVRKKR